MSILQLAVPESLRHLLESPETAKWYAVYTAPRHEKRVTRYVEGQQIECFLPLYKSVRRWKDRRKEIDLPLFPGYVFVHFALPDRLRVLQAPGVLQLVSFQGQPAALPDVDIELLRNGLAGYVRAEPHPYLAMGRRVRVRSGAVAGMEGILVRRKQKFRVVLSINLIQRSVAIEVDEADIEALPCSAASNLLTKYRNGFPARLVGY